MKCLRCGREIGDNTECDCGHFYENNIGENAKKKKQANGIVKLFVILFAIYFGFAFIAIFAIGLADVLKTKNNQNKEINNEFCSIKCESDVFSVKDNYCVCSSGKKYLIEDK